MRTRNVPAETVGLNLKDPYYLHENMRNAGVTQ